MKPNTSPIERAFELAQSGRFLYVSEIRFRLHQEGYLLESITGPSLLGKLRAEIKNALKQQRKPLPLNRSERAQLW
jgi:hypothetical protein